MLPKYYKNEMMKMFMSFLEAPVIMQASLCCIFFLFVVVVIMIFLFCVNSSKSLYPLISEKRMSFLD